MADIHDTILREGFTAASQQAVGRSGKKLAQVAAAILSEESSALGMTYSGFCLTSLPHRQIPDTEVWKREGQFCTLIIQPGYIRRNERTCEVGVPYGSRARLILLYLQTRAVQTRSPVVELGGSMREWLQRMGLSVGGKQYQDTKDQAERISACTLSFLYSFTAKDKEYNGLSKSSFIDDAFFAREGVAANDTDWQNEVTISDKFFKALTDHPVPLWEPAIRELGNRSMAIDIYVWLAYRLHVLTKATPITWSAIQDQFGAGFSAVRSFRQAFKESLEFAKAVYPDAYLDVTETGVTLFPSRPPVDHKTMISFAGKSRSK